MSLITRILEESDIAEITEEAVEYIFNGQIPRNDYDELAEVAVAHNADSAVFNPHINRTWKDGKNHFSFEVFSLGKHLVEILIVIRIGAKSMSKQEMREWLQELQREYLEGPCFEIPESWTKAKLEDEIRSMFYALAWKKETDKIHKTLKEKFGEHNYFNRDPECVAMRAKLKMPYHKANEYWITKKANDRIKALKHD